VERTGGALPVTGAGGKKILCGAMELKRQGGTLPARKDVRKYRTRWIRSYIFNERERD